MNGIENHPHTDLQTKALYKAVDSRHNIYSLDSLKLEPAFTTTIKTQAMSVVCLMHESFLQKTASGDFQLHPLSPKLGDQHNLVMVGGKREPLPYGENEPFYHEEAPGFGTAFLVGSKHLMTAAHCVCKQNSNVLDLDRIQKTVAVFDFQLTKKDENKRDFSKKDVHRVTVVAHQFIKTADKYIDWALLKLDRIVEGRRPLDIKVEKIANQIDLYMLGHPSGLPLKLTDGAEVKNHHIHCFEANLDACGGNSGSPVFEKKSQEVVAILVSGNEDFEANLNYQNNGIARSQSHHVTSTEIASRGYERCQRISEIGWLNYVRAKQGIAEGQYQLGLQYLTGKEMKKDEKKGKRCLQKAAYQGHALAQSKFNELSDIKIENLDSISSDFRKLAPGLSLEGICKNQTCTAHEQIIWINKGVGNYNIPLESDEAKCPKCAQTAQEINKIVFWKCTFTIKGKLKNHKEQYCVTDAISAEKVKKFDFVKDRNWFYLEATSSS